MKSSREITLRKDYEMRDFNNADRKKKKQRIQIPENPAGLSKEALSQLEDTVKASLKDGYLPCPLGWKIAKDAGVPRIAVGEITDRLGIRIIDCQIGFFKVDKTPYDDSSQDDIDGEVVASLQALADNDQLTCAKIFDLAQQYKLKPLTVANAANDHRLSIRNCQLGCF